MVLNTLLNSPFVLRPEAVGLVDAFDIHDETLCSALGSYNGRAYERLYQSALRDPMNKQEVMM